MSVRLAIRTVLEVADLELLQHLRVTSKEIRTVLRLLPTLPAPPADEDGVDYPMPLMVLSDKTPIIQLLERD